MAVRALRMTCSRNVVGFPWGPPITGRTDDMASRTASRSTVIHCRRRPGSAYLMAVAASIGGHRGCSVRVSAGGRSAGCMGAIVTSGASACAGYAGMGKLGRLPGGGVMAGITLRITGRGKVVRALARGVPAVMTIGASACRRRDQAGVVESTRFPCLLAVTNTALLSADRYVIRGLAGRDRAIVTA